MGKNRSSNSKKTKKKKKSSSSSPTKGTTKPLSCEALQSQSSSINHESLSSSQPIVITTHKPTISQFSSWNQAFQAAASIVPHDLGKDYNPDDTASHTLEEGGNRSSHDNNNGNGNVLNLSQLALECIHKNKNIHDNNCNDNHDDDTNPVVKNFLKRCREINKEIEALMDTAIEEPPKKKEKKKKDKKKKKKDKKKNNEKSKEQDEEEPLSSLLLTQPIESDNIQDFPYPVDSDDHCESPLTAFEDIQPILDQLVQILGKQSKDQLKIYDPYYCNGSVIDHLHTLGYTNVYNRKEDCYNIWTSSLSTESSSFYPDYDVFMTNPPYSSDHIQKLIDHLTNDPRTKDKPWCLLMPTYVHKKDFYDSQIASKKNKKKLQPFYLVPKKRYVYLPPKDFREKKMSDVHKKSSPFVSMWYVWGGSKSNTEVLIKAYRGWERKDTNNCKCDLARTKSALRDLRRKNGN